MRTPRRILMTLLLALAATAGACRNGGALVGDGRGGDDEQAPGGQIALLEHEYSNFAWGYQHRGIAITDEGNVIAYQWARDDRPWVESGEPLTAAQLSAKYDHARRHLGTVSADTVQMIRHLIPAASRGAMSDTTWRGADMGQTNRLAWLLDTTTGRYQRIVLLSTGDAEWRNTSIEAVRLAEIIDAIAERYPWQ